MTNVITKSAREKLNPTSAQKLEVLESIGYTIEEYENGDLVVSAPGVVFISLRAPQRPEYIEIDSERFQNLSEERRYTYEHQEDGMKFFRIDPEAHREWEAYDKAYLRLVASARR